eukprot:CAMPEP_0185161764 /NCGR_PEP_ID=MMETSP1139-20130426/5498_1 /TAXON_ID=298111 /ORGANISM="Pavlova sp., Strain CCMP459" /LENGTH=111 /DNA_ID=CAMNT_0027727049 /DNA_START=301 /DNA_END=637 /DNA_ORIENTATION=+
MASLSGAHVDKLAGVPRPDVAIATPSLGCQPFTSVAQGPIGGVRRSSRSPEGSLPLEVRAGGEGAVLRAPAGSCAAAGDTRPPPYSQVRPSQDHVARASVDQGPLASTACV